MHHLASQNTVDLMHFSAYFLSNIQKVVREEPIIRLDQSFKLISLAAVSFQANSFYEQVSGVAVRFIFHCEIVA